MPRRTYRPCERASLRRRSGLLSGQRLVLVLASHSVRLRGDKLREMFPDNLFLCIALHRLGARVPGQDVALGIEHKDGVVSYAFDEHTKEIAVFDEPIAARAVNVNGDWRGCHFYPRGMKPSDYLAKLWPHTISTYLLVWDDKEWNSVKDWIGVVERAVRKSHPRHGEVELPVSLKVPSMIEKSCADRYGWITFTDERRKHRVPRPVGPATKNR